MENLKDHKQNRDKDFKTWFERNIKELTKDNWEKEFFNQLADKLEEFFEKGERCQCGRKLPCRSKALAFNAFANLIFINLIKKLK